LGNAKVLDMKQNAQQSHPKDNNISISQYFAQHLTSLWHGVQCDVHLHM